MDQEAGNGTRTTTRVTAIGIVFGVEEKDDNFCKGCKRFLVIEAEMNDPEDYEYTLEELNDGYPKELLRKHGIL